MFRAQGHDELLVGLLLTVFVEHAHVGLPPVERLTSLAQAAGQAVVDQRQLEHTLESLDDAHLALRGGGVGSDLDLVGGGHGRGGLFSVRLSGRSVLGTLDERRDMVPS